MPESGQGKYLECLHGRYYKRLRTVKIRATTNTEIKLKK